MTPAGGLLRDEAHAALASLERLLKEPAEAVAGDVAETVREIVRLRDELIDRRRAGDASPLVADWLDRTNAILSSVIGAEFPIKGLHRKRLATARDAFERMLAE